jgi:hypothetical protein
MSKKLRELQSKKADAVGKMRELNDKATAENRALSADEQSHYETHKAAVATLNADIVREQELIDLEASLPAPSRQAGGQGFVALRPGAQIDTEENVEKDAKRGFKSFGDFAASVRHATSVSRTGNGAMDKRAAAATAAS